MFSFPGMEKLFLIGTGGFIGACLRYMVSSQVSRIKNISAGTLTVNLLGTIVLAFLTFSSEPKSMVYLVNIGILGSFSTFSTFAYKTFKLLEEGQNFSFFLNIFLNVTLCLGVSIAFLAPSFEFNTESWVKTFSGKYCSRNYSSINKIFLIIYSKIQKAKSQSKF